jgi:acetyl esterase/lipase
MRVEVTRNRIKTEDDDIGVRAGSAIVPPNSVPARVSNLKGVPPAFIGVGSIDLFAPKDIEYAQRLLAAGVAVELNVVPGAFHSFDGIASLPEGSPRRGERCYAGPLHRQHENLKRLMAAQGKNRISRVECAALTIKTWNAFVGGGYQHSRVADCECTRLSDSGELQLFDTASVVLLLDAPFCVTISDGFPDGASEGTVKLI